MISVYKGMGISANFKTVFLILRVHLRVSIPSGRPFDFNKVKMLNLTLHLKDSLMKKICGSVRKHIDVFVFASISIHPSIHPCMALQPLPGLGLPQNLPPFVPVFSFSSPSSYS